MHVIACNEIYYIVLQIHYMSLHRGGFAMLNDLNLKARNGNQGFEYLPDQANGLEYMSKQLEKTPYKDPLPAQRGTLVKRILTCVPGPAPFYHCNCVFQQFTSIRILDGRYEIPKASLDRFYRIGSLQSPTHAKQNQNFSLGEQEHKK